MVIILGTNTFRISFYMYLRDATETSWHRLVSAQFPIIYLYIFSHLLARKFKVKLMY